MMMTNVNNRCENTFKAVQEANSLIGTSEARKQYDQQSQYTNLFQNSNSNSNHRNTNRSSNLGDENPFNRWFNEHGATDYTPGGAGRRSHRYQFPQRRRFYVNGIDISHLFNPQQAAGNNNNNNFFSTNSMFQNRHPSNPTTMNDDDITMPKSIFVQRVTVSLEELYCGVSRKEFQCKDDILQRYR